LIELEKFKVPQLE
jgi:hypothetical protein